MHHLTFLKQVRKNLNLSLQDTAFLLGTDVSNLSKYEYGKMTPSVRVIIGYHLITRTPLQNLIKHHIAEVHATLLDRVRILLSKTGGETRTEKALLRRETLQQILEILNNNSYGS